MFNQKKIVCKLDSSSSGRFVARIPVDYCVILIAVVLHSLIVVSDPLALLACVISDTSVNCIAYCRNLWNANERTLCIEMLKERAINNMDIGNGLRYAKCGLPLSDDEIPIIRNTQCDLIKLTLRQHGILRNSQSSPCMQ